MSVASDWFDMESATPSARAQLDEKLGINKTKNTADSGQASETSDVEVEKEADADWFARESAAIDERMEEEPHD